MSADHESDLPRVLIALPEGPTRDRLIALLRERDVEIEATPDDPREGLGASSADLVVVRREDLTADDHRRLDVLARDESAPDVVVVGGDMDDSAKVDLVAAGATDVFDATELDVRAADSLEVMAGGSGGHATPEGAQPSLSDFASRSKSMHALIELVQRVAPTDSTLLIGGETGVGKEHLARAIHTESLRRRGPFVAVNCGALPEQLLESELFGHATGAFTGASGPRKGLFQAADKGTLLLDEIGEMALHLQIKLLRVLQRGEIRAVGSDESARVDVRVIAATNRDLRRQVEKGTFREDLFFRLNVVELVVPPLRDRTEDLPALIGSLIRHCRSQTGRTEIESIDDEALGALVQYAWPGNVRELIHVLERAMLVCRGDVITVADLPAQVLDDEGRSVGGSLGTLPDELLELEWREVRRRVLEAAERTYLEAALRRCQGVIGATANHAGLSSRSLYDKMKAHGLRKEDFA